MAAGNQDLTRDKGFTLVELMIVVAIIGVLLGIAVATYTFSVSRVAVVACEHNRRVLQEAVTVYRSSNDGESPNSIEDLQPYASTYERIVICPGDDETVLRFDPATQSIKCDFHQ